MKFGKSEEEKKKRKEGESFCNLLRGTRFSSLKKNNQAATLTLFRFKVY